MKLQDAILAVMKDFGKDIFTRGETGLNVIGIYNAFDESKALEFILKVLVKEGYVEQISRSIDWDICSNSLISQFVENTGFQYQKSAYLFNCFAYAYGLTNRRADLLDTPTVPTMNPTTPTVTPTQIAIPVDDPIDVPTPKFIPSVKLNLNEDELYDLFDNEQEQYKINAEEYLDSILEINGDSEKDLGLGIRVFSEFDVDSNDFNFLLKIHGTLKSNIESVSFKFTSYNASGRILCDLYADITKDEPDYSFLYSSIAFEREFRTISNISRVVLSWQKQLKA